MGFGKEIKRLREGVPISVDKIAKRVGVDPDRWRKWEEKDFNPRNEDTAKIEKFFGMDLSAVQALENIKKFLKVPRETGTLDEAPEKEDINALYIQSLRDRVAEHKERIEEVKAILEAQNRFLQDLIEKNLDALQVYMVKSSTNLTTIVANQSVTQETARVILERDVHREAGGNQKKHKEIMDGIRKEILKNIGLEVKTGIHDGEGIASK